MRWLFGLLLTVLTVSACNADRQMLVIVNSTSPDYSIVVPTDATAMETKSAKVLQDYIQKISGKILPITKDTGVISHAIYLGRTRKGLQLFPGKLAVEGYKMQVTGTDLFICGGSGKGLLYGVYAFIEKQLGCKKIADCPAILPKSKEIKIPADLHMEGRPQFVYRESFYPASRDQEYLDWNKLQQFENLWGLWGHSYNKLVPAATYFKKHPEYYALVKGIRQPSQLCLSNEDVLAITSKELKRMIAENPSAVYWSVSPNDDMGYCECDKCKAIDNTQGSPAGSLIKFVNRIAAQFPDKYITTLAYGYTHRAPKNLKPAKNVYVFLSTIDIYRDKPLTEDSSATTFRNDVKAWGALTPNLFVWDYVTQFTNYLAPFPNILTLQPNMQYYKENGIKGVFVQGSGDTYGEWAELRSYVVTKLLEDDKADAKALTESFLQDYYGPAAKFLLQYVGQLHGNMEMSKRKLDIYGNPVNQWDSYLSPDKLDAYTKIFDAAEGAVERKPLYAERVMRARLPLEYTILQQARFYGIEQYGTFVKDRNSKWIVPPMLAERVTRFVANCKKAKVVELSEGGPTPDAYQAEWNDIFRTGVTPTIATSAKVSLKYPFAPEYPAKGNRTLVDGTRGYADFSYNWLCFYGVDMVATVDLGRQKNIESIRVNFLDDPRHWIFLPAAVTIELSDDGVNFRHYEDITPAASEEHYDVKITRNLVMDKAKARYIRVTANNLPALPIWRYRENRKPMIACDEIFVQ